MTLDIPTDTAQNASEEREKVLQDAVVLFDARFITQGQAAENVAIRATNDI